MTAQEYRKELETKATAQLKKLAQVAARGTICKVSNYSREGLIGFLVSKKFYEE